MCREISFPAVYHGIPVYRYTVKKWQIGQITGKKAGIPVNLLPVLERLYRYLIDYIGVDLYYTAAAWKAYNTENPIQIPDFLTLISTSLAWAYSQLFRGRYISGGRTFHWEKSFSRGEVFFRGRGQFQEERFFQRKRYISGGEVFFRGIDLFQRDRSISGGEVFSTGRGLF